MAEFYEPFSFLFLITLSIFLSPKEQGMIQIDRISTTTGEVQMMHAKLTHAGFRVKTDPGIGEKVDISIQIKKGSKFIFYTINETGENESINLEEVVKKIKPFQECPQQTVVFPNDTIKFVLSDKILYIYLERNQKMLVVH